MPKLKKENIIYLASKLEHSARNETAEFRELKQQICEAADRELEAKTLRNYRVNNPPLSQKTYLHIANEIEILGNLALELCELGGAQQSEETSTQIKDLHHQIQIRIKQVTLAALQILEDIITGKVPASISLRAKCASEHLGRFTQLTEHRGIQESDIEEIKARASAANNSKLELQSSQLEAKFKTILAEIYRLAQR